MLEEEREPLHHLFRREGKDENIGENSDPGDGGYDALPDTDAMRPPHVGPAVDFGQFEGIRAHFQPVGGDGETSSQWKSGREQADVAELDHHLQVIVKDFIRLLQQVPDGLKRETSCKEFERGT